MSYSGLSGAIGVVAGVSGGASTVCIEGVEVIENPVEQNTEILPGQVLRTGPDAEVIIALVDGSRVTLRGSRELYIDRKGIEVLRAESEQDPSAEDLQAALLAGADPAQFGASAAGPDVAGEGGTSFVVVERNGERGAVDPSSLESDAVEAFTAGAAIGEDSTDLPTVQGSGQAMEGVRNIPLVGSVGIGVTPGTDAGGHASSSDLLTSQTGDSGGATTGSASMEGSASVGSTVETTASGSTSDDAAATGTAATETAATGTTATGTTATGTTAIGTAAATAGGASGSEASATEPPMQMTPEDGCTGMGAELSVPSPGDEVVLFAYQEGSSSQTLWTLVNLAASSGEMADLTAGIGSDLNLGGEGTATLQWMSSSNNIQIGKMCVGGAHVDDLPPVLKNPFAGGAKNPTTGIELTLSASGEDTAADLSHTLLGAGDAATDGNDIFDGGLLEYADMLSLDAGDGIDMLVVEDASTDLADLQGSNLEVVNLGVDPSGKTTDNTLELSATDILDLASTDGNRLYVTGDGNDTVKISDLDAAGTVDGWQVYDSAFLAVQLYVQDGVSVEHADPAG